MYVCWDVYQDTYQDIWVGRVIIIIEDASYESAVCLAMFACIGFYFKFSVLWSLYYTYSHPALPLVFYSTSLLLLSNHTMGLPYLISYALHACAYDMVSMFMIQIYRYTCAYPYSPSGFRITTRRGVLTPLDPHVQVLELGACGFSQLLIRVA